MPERLSLSDDLTDGEWLAALEEIGDRRGFAQRLGKEHLAVFAEGEHAHLLVTFESMAGIRATADNGLPLGFSVADQRGWAHLSLVARGEPWFRKKKIWAFFDRLTDDDFFEDYSTVLFYGRRKPEQQEHPPHPVTRQEANPPTIEPAPAVTPPPRFRWRRRAPPLSPWRLKRR